MTRMRTCSQARITREREIQSALERWVLERKSPGWGRFGETGRCHGLDCVSMWANRMATK